jgi:hypothetical protein
MAQPSTRTSPPDQPAASSSRNAVSDHTLLDDIEQIHSCAEEYARLTASERADIAEFIIDGQKIDFYYGSWVALFQVFTMVHIASMREGGGANTNMRDALRPILYGHAHKIVEMIREST